MHVDLKNVRPLVEYATQVEHTFARVVTYEDVVQRQPGAVALAMPNTRLAALNYGMPDRALSVHMTTKPADGLSALRVAVLAFNASQADRAYEIRESSVGLQLVPIAARNSLGVVFPVESPLDLKIAVPIAERTPTAHFEEICAAMSSAAKVSVQFIDGAVLRPYLDDFFAGKAKTLIWGTGGATARDALIDLLSHSASTLTWHMRCTPPSGGKAEFCTFNVRPLSVDTAGEGQPPRLHQLSYDRCPECRPVNPLRPPPPPPQK